MPQHCYNTIFDLHQASIAAWWLLTSPLIAPYAPLDTFHSIFHYQSQSIAVPRLVEHGLRHCVQGGLKKPCLSQHRIPDFSHEESSWNTWNILKRMKCLKNLKGDRTTMICKCKLTIWEPVLILQDLSRFFKIFQDLSRLNHDLTSSQWVHPSVSWFLCASHARAWQKSRRHKPSQPYQLFLNKPNATCCKQFQNGPKLQTNTLLEYTRIMRSQLPLRSFTKHTCKAHWDPWLNMTKCCACQHHESYEYIWRDMKRRKNINR